MRKVEPKYDNPIDNIIVDMGDRLMPYLKSSGHTPNMLTTYSLILGLAAVYFLYKNDIFKFGVCFILAYVCDCWDGYMARKYNMVSEFGDLYDHISDVAVGLSLAYVAYTKYKHKLTVLLVIVIGVMTYLMQKHVGCYQKMYIDTNKKEKETIDFVSDLCENKNDIKWTRFFGPGTYNTVFIVGLMYYLNNN